MRKIKQISISAADRERLERLVRDRNTPQKVVWRARIVLLASDGLTAEGIAAAVDKSLLTVRTGLSLGGRKLFQREAQRDRITGLAKNNLV